MLFELITYPSINAFYRNGNRCIGVGSDITCPWKEAFKGNWVLLVTPGIGVPSDDDDDDDEKEEDGNIIPLEVLEVDWLVCGNVFCTWGPYNNILIVSGRKEVVVAVGLQFEDCGMSARAIHSTPSSSVKITFIKGGGHFDTFDICP
jgi:hypothetical protein